MQRHWIKKIMRDPAKALESRVRRLAARYGYGIRKSRCSISLDNFGEYRLFDSALNYVVLGARFDATLDDITEFINAPESEPEAEASNPESAKKLRPVIRPASG